MSKQYGRYIDGSSDFCITEADIPRNWYNYFWNDDYITYTSQVCAGESFLQDNMGRRIKLVRDRGFFITEGEASRGIGGLPVNEKRDAYRCVHKRGLSELYTEKCGIASTVSIFVPRELACVKFDKVYSSDLQRARVTAETALPGCEYETIPLLREISLGSLEGTPIKPNWSQTLASRTENVIPTGGESTAQFRARISEFLEMMQAVPYETVAAFAHGGWLTNAFCVICGVDIPRKNIYCGNCATLILEWTGTAWRITGWINLPEENPELP